jgi:nitroimidazol reductase NimA-like FMN-containing flavoprotein (pyridoxamine 5'-phosphate oxidase superfamily)
MNEPVTTMDARFSDPDAVATPWEQTRRVLETAELFWISTVRADGRPHVTPLIVVWLDGSLHFCSGVTQQKAVNLRGNPHVILTTGCNHWEEGLDVVVEGDAVRITDHDRLERLASVWATRWDGRFHFLVRNGYFYHHDEHEAPVGEAVLVFEVLPSKIFAFAQGVNSGTNSHTRHQF